MPSVGPEVASVASTEASAVAAAHLPSNDAHIHCKRAPQAPTSPPVPAAAAKPAAAIRAPLRFQNVTNSETVAHLRKVVLDLVFGSTPYKPSTYLGARSEIPGPLACALTRVSLAESLAKVPYSVCEKSDGERRLMLITPFTDATPTVYLVDRSFAFQTLHGTISCGAARPAEPVSRVMSRAVSRAGPTLIDGELVVRPARAELGPAGAEPTNVFLVFDAVCVGGRRVAELPLQRRLAAIGTGVREPLRADDNSRLRARLPLLPLLLLGKAFRPARDLMAVLAKVEQWPASLAPPAPGELKETSQPRTVGLAADSASAPAAGSTSAPAASSTSAPAAAVSTASAALVDVGRETVSVYVDGQRVNGNDGLVFTPERVGYLQLLAMPDRAPPGSAQPVQPLLKWKPLMENTVDFVIQRAELERARRGLAGAKTTVSLAARDGRKGNVELTTARMEPRGAAELLAVMDEAGREAELVVECAADAEAATAVLRAVAGPAGVAAVSPDRHFAAALRASWETKRFYPRWRVMRARADKSRANAAMTAWSTLEVLADNVTPADIAAALSPRSA